jgi:hypothetical protein
MRGPFQGIEEHPALYAVRHPQERGSTSHRNLPQATWDDAAWRTAEPADGGHLVASAKMRAAEIID